MKRIVIFDFDGTLADTFALTVDIFYKLKPVPVIFPKKEVERLRGMALLEVARELNIRWWEVPLLLMRGRKMMARRLGEIQLISGVREVLADLHKQGFELHIVSSNSEGNIRSVLERHNVESYFTSVHGVRQLHGKQRLIARLTNRGAKTWYVGDEVRDIEAARRAHVISVAVTWGYNNVGVLKNHSPDFLVFTPDELQKAIES